MKLKITTEHFLSYLESLGLHRWTISNTGRGIEAILVQDCNPSIEDFTSVQRRDDGTWVVMLSTRDYFNDSITKGYFYG